MLRHYLTAGLRHLYRHRGYAAITVFGLAIGIAASLLIGLYAQDELLFDRFHDNADRVVRLTQEYAGPGEPSHVPLVTPATGPALQAEFAAIEEVVRLGITAPIVLGHEATPVVPKGPATYYATPDVFTTLTFPLVQGDPGSALEDPYSIVVTESFARRVEPSGDILGAVLDFRVHGVDRRGLTVTGILEDVPARSHLQFEVLVSFATLEDINRNNPNWENQRIATYLLLADARARATIRQELPAFLERHLGAEAAQGRSLHLQSLTDIHLGSTGIDSDLAVRGDRQLVYLLLAIAAGILLMAAMNFANLTTARASRRAEEIGVRKSFGAHRRQLAGQFLGESILVSVVAMGLALIAVELLLPGFRSFTGKALSIPYGAGWPLLAAFTLLIGLVSGAYPAAVLSVQRPLAVLRRQVGRHRSATLRRILVGTQFTMATLLVIGTAVVYQQLRFIQDSDLGFENDRVVQTVIPSNTASGNLAFQDDLRRHPNVLEIGRAVVRPLYDMQSSFPASPTLAEMEGEMAVVEPRIRNIEVGHGFVEAFGMRMMAGDTFPVAAEDPSNLFLLNETAVREIGWASPEMAIGKAMRYDDVSGTVGGVLEDFHFEGMESRILPFVVRYNRFSPMVFVKIGPGDPQETLAHIEESWERHSTSEEAFNYRFMSDYYDDHYAGEARLRTILLTFAGLGLLITCLGILGLTAFTVEQRRREFGVRKVLGASVASLVALGSGELVPLFVLANVLAWPVAYVSVTRWLEAYAYHVEPGLTTFLLAALVVGGLTTATAGLRAFLVAGADPVRVLRDD